MLTDVCSQRVDCVAVHLDGGRRLLDPGVVARASEQELSCFTGENQHGGQLTHLAVIEPGRFGVACLD